MKASIPILIAAIALSAGLHGCHSCSPYTPGMPSVAFCRPVTVADLPTFAKTESLYRWLRNAAFESLGDNPASGTYTLSMPIRLVALTNGWQVSFQTTVGEGLYGTPLPDAEYDRIVDELSNVTGSAPYLGIHEGIPELSFCCGTKELALEIAAKYNQSCIVDNARIASGKTDEFSFPKNPHYDSRQNPLFIDK